MYKRQLEELGFIRKDKKGRVITPKGQSYLAKKANELRKKLLSEGKLMIALPEEEKPKAQAKGKKAGEKQPEKETKKETKKEAKGAKSKRGKRA